MRTHPAAELFPLLTGEAFEALVADIKANGQIHPIVTIGGLVLDGRNRLAACEAAGVEPEFVEYRGKDPLSYVVGANLSRRHLDASQRAMMGARLKPLFEAEAQERMLAGALAPKDARAKASEKAAAAVGVSPRGVERAAKVLATGAKATIAAVDTGNLAVTRAAKIAELPKKEQPSAILEAPDTDAPDDYSEEDQQAEHDADFTAMLKIVDSDDKLAAAVEELRAARRLHAVTQGLYEAMSRDVATYKKEAQRWMKKAKKSAACQDCMTALERES